MSHLFNFLKRLNLHEIQLSTRFCKDLSSVVHRVIPYLSFHTAEVLVPQNFKVTNFGTNTAIFSWDDLPDASQVSSFNITWLYGPPLANGSSSASVPKSSPQRLHGFTPGRYYLFVIVPLLSDIRYQPQSTYFVERFGRKDSATMCKYTLCIDGSKATTSKVYIVCKSCSHPHFIFCYFWSLGVESIFGVIIWSQLIWSQFLELIILNFLVLDIKTY